MSLGGQRVCFFGGTFDPIHNAHLQIAANARNAFQLDRVLFVPAGNPPHKEAGSVAPYEDRYQMVVAAVANMPGFEASRLEESPESSYSVDTIWRLRTLLPANDEILFLIGSDAFSDLESWKNWRDLIGLVTFIVATRPGSDYRSPAEARILRLNSVALGISSSEIRARLAAGQLTPELPEPVQAYVQRHALYTNL